MIVRYQQANIKGITTSFDMAPVTVVCGPNRSGKSSRLEGLSLAATGSSFIGATAMKISELIGGQGKSASSSIDLDCGTVCTWTIERKTDGRCSSKAKADGKHSFDQLFGSFITPDQFWGLTAEQKWKEIGALVARNNPTASESAIVLAKKYAVANMSDTVSLCEAIEAAIVSEIQQLKTERHDNYGSLKPPKEYSGRALPILQAERQELERFIADQRAARKNMHSRKEAEAKRAAEMLEIRTTIASTEAQLEVMRAQSQKLAECIEQVTPIAKSLTDRIASEDAVISKCRIATVGEVWQDCRQEIQQGAEKLKAMVQHFVLPEHQILINGLENLLDSLLITEELACIKLFEPEQVEQIREILRQSIVRWKPQSLSDYCSAPSCIGHELAVANNSIDKLEAQLAQQNRRLTKLEAEQQVAVVSTVELCSEEELVAKVLMCGGINEEIEKAQQWPLFLKRQAEVAALISRLDAQLEELDTDLHAARNLRAELINGAIEPVESEANKIVCGMGYSPIKLTAIASGKRLTLEVCSASGVSLSAMCGAEAVVYKLAMLYALHQLSPHRSPLRLIECAELDSEQLTKLVEVLVEIGGKGNTVLASWVMPSLTNEVATVVDCTAECVV